MNGKSAKLIRKYISKVFQRTQQHLPKHAAYRTWKRQTTKQRRAARKEFRRAIAAI